MQDSLYEFLIVNKKLSLPGIGTVGLLRNAAQLDFTNKQLIPPSFVFTIESNNDKPSKKLFEWLSSSRGISDWDAIRAVNDFAFALKEKISNYGEMTWDKVGVFRRDGSGNIIIESYDVTVPCDQPVKAEKVIREKAEHMVLVGEQERTSVQMTEYFAQEQPKKNYVWIIAIVIAVAALLFIGWYFSQKGFLPSSTGNQSVIKPR